MRRTGSAVIETRHRTKDGRIFPVEVHTTRLRLGDLEIHCASAHDITQRRRAEAALRENEERLRLALEATSDGIGGPGGPLRMTGSHTDIQARKEAEAALRRSLAEKEVLLREVHHRVKNNLQVVSSLLSMQARSAGGEARDTFREAQARIRSMSLVHELLHRSRDLAHVDLPSYLDAVVRGLEGSYAAGARKVTLVQEVAAVEVSADCAIPCGLVVNELVSNAYRHAFPGDRRGEVRLRVRQEPGGTLELTVADDGIGLPDGVDPDRSLGLRIVRLLAEQQLRGSLEVARAGGTRFTVRFAPP